MLILLLLLLIFAILINYTSIFSFLNFTTLSNEGFENLLNAINLLLAFLLAITKYYKDRKEDKKLYYSFDTYNHFLPLNSPQIVDSLNSNLLYFSGVTKLNENSVFCYKLNMYTTTKDIANSVSIPFLIKLNTHCDIKYLKFSYIKIFLFDGEKTIKLCCEKSKFKIKISDNGFFYICFDIFCNRADEKNLIDGRFLVFAKTKAYDVYNKNIKKYFIINTQNIKGISVVHDYYQCRSLIKYLYHKFNFKHNSFKEPFYIKKHK